MRIVLKMSADGPAFGGDTPSANIRIHLALWIVQVVLAAIFAIAGVMQAAMPIAALAQNLPWTPDLPLTLVRFIGVAQLAAAVGLVLPGATRIRPQLTGSAAVGLVATMALAIPFHIIRGEPAPLPANLLLGAAALFIAWGRLKKAPIEPRL